MKYMIHRGVLSEEELADPIIIEMSELATTEVDFEKEGKLLVDILNNHLPRGTHMVVLDTLMRFEIGFGYDKIMALLHNLNG